MKETRSTCPYCGVGCGVIIQSEGEQVTGVRGDPDHPANHGRLCTKGSTLHLTASASVTLQTRLLQPMQRVTRGTAPRAIPWDTALDTVATRLAQVALEHGPDAIGLYVSGQLLTEDYYVFNKLAKGLLGTNNIDTNSRLCMSSAVAGYKRSLGADAPPCSYDDLHAAQTVFIAGSNTAWAHPILMRRLEDARRANPAQKWIVVDPRRTETAEAADLHLPILPGTDVALFNGMAHLLLWEGLADTAFVAAHTQGLPALRDMVRNCTPALTAQLCGIKEEALVQATRWFGGHTPTLSLYCQGLNQSSSGTDKNTALINLHLLTGQIGKPGAGPFSLTGQPNAMGGREVGGLANLLSAHRDLANPQHRAEVAALWGIDSVPEHPGKTAIEMFKAAADGDIKALWIVCTNPAQSLPDQTMVKRALERCPFVVVQEACITPTTTRYADVLLPATPWAEKDGTVTNSERRISRVRAAIAPAGQTRDDWRIAVAVAQRLEALLPRKRHDGQSLFAFDSAESVWCEHRASTRGRDLDITGLSYAVLETLGPQPWPMPEGSTQGKPRLYEDGIFPTADGRAQLIATQARPLAEKRDAHHPFTLNTGRLRDAWHSGSRTGTLGRLFGHASEPSAQMHPSDLARLRVNSGELITLKSRRASLTLPVQADDSVAPTQAFVAMHWGDEYLVGGVNALTTAAFCPHSKQPELKGAAVKIGKATFGWQLFARAWLPSEVALQQRAALLALLSHLPYACCVPFGREPAAHVGVLLRAAADTAPSDDVLAQVAKLLALDGPEVLRYVDPKLNQRRAVRMQRLQRLQPIGADDDPSIPEPTDGPSSVAAFLLTGDIQAAPWMGELLLSQAPADAYGRALLWPGAVAPLTMPARGPQVCSCFDVHEPAIEAALAQCQGSADHQLAQVQSKLQCGTQCGSCLPQLRTLVRRHLQVA